MKLTVYLHPLGDESLGLLNALIPEKARKIVSARWAVDSDDPALPQILRAGDSTGGFWVSAESVFTAAESRAFSHFEIICRKLVRETGEDYDRNMAACLRAPLTDRGGDSPIRLTTGFSLAKISMKPNMVGAIGDWTGEYVIGSAVADVIKSSNFSGVKLLPVHNPETDAPYADFFQIYSDSLLEPAALDCSIEHIESDDPEENGKLRHLGCLCYREEILLETPDFSRTAEPWSGWWGWPSWVVSNRVAKSFRQQKLRGWAFRPVLVADSTLYSAYLSHWKRLVGVISECRSSSFDGGRW